MKFPTPQGKDEMCENQALAKQYYLMAHQAGQTSGLLVEGLATRHELTKKRGKLAEDLVTISLHDRDPQHIQIGSMLNIN